MTEGVKVNRRKKDDQLSEVVPNCEAMHAWDERCFEAMAIR